MHDYLVSTYVKGEEYYENSLKCIDYFNQKICEATTFTDDNLYLTNDIETFNRLVNYIYLTNYRAAPNKEYVGFALESLRIAMFYDSNVIFQYLNYGDEYEATDNSGNQIKARA